MEEEAPVKRSVAELAGRFKDAAAAPDNGLSAAPKPVRRRPPRTLQIPAPPTAEQEKADGPASPFAAGRPKRNSALIEKLQANLALSPAALSPSAFLPSPKSPGLKPFSPTFPCPPSSSLDPVAVALPGTPTSPLALPSPQSEEEVPVSFETPATTQDGAMLLSFNKSRARPSIKRRPPSRRNRTSSSTEDGGVSPGAEDAPGPAPAGAPGEEKPTGREEADGTAEGAAQRNQEVFEREEAPSATEGEGHAVTHPGPPPEPQAPNSTETKGGGGGGEPDESLANREEESCDRKADESQVI